MNGRKLYREYAKSRGVDCAEFISVEEDYYFDILHYKDSSGKACTLTIDYKNMVRWIIKAMPNSAFDGMKNIKND